MSRKKQALKDQVLKELCAGARAACEAQGKESPPDAELIPILMDSYRRCPHCQAHLDFRPEVVIHTVTSRDEFMVKLGEALGPHYKSSPACQRQAKAMLDTPELRAHVKRWGMRLGSAVVPGVRTIKIDDLNQDLLELNAKYVDLKAEDFAAALCSIAFLTLQADDYEKDKTSTPPSRQAAMIWDGRRIIVEEQ
jgi:hypothetical protein